MNLEKSMIEVAFDALKKHKKGLLFEDLFKKICKECEIKEEEKKKKLVMFYNNLTLDGRFSHDPKTDLWILSNVVDSTINVNEEDNISKSEEEEAEEKEIEKEGNGIIVEDDEDSSESDSNEEENNN